MKKVLQKWRRAAGFTMAETLIAAAILVLITSAALPAALTAYRNAVDAANAQVLLSTAVNALRGELSTAMDVELGTATVQISDTEESTFPAILYRSSGVDHGSKLFVNDDGVIMLEQYGLITAGWLDDGIQTKAPRPLLSSALRQTTRSGGEYMTVTYDGDSVSLSNDGYVTISNLRVERGDKTIADMPATGLVIRVMTTTTTGG